MNRITITLSDEDMQRLKERSRSVMRGVTIEAARILHDFLTPVVDDNPTPWREWDIGRDMPLPEGIVEVQYREGRRAIDRADLFLGWRGFPGKPWAEIVAWRPIQQVLPGTLAPIETVPSALPNGEPWRSWRGKGRHPIGKVQVEFRDIQRHDSRQGIRTVGCLKYTRNAREFVWKLTGGPDDIIRWRYVK